MTRILLPLLVLGLGVITAAAVAEEGSYYDDDREGGAGARAPSTAAGTSILARRSHRLIGGGEGSASHAAAGRQPTSMAVAEGGGGDSGGGHEAYVAARGARMPLDLLMRVLHTSAESELAGEEGLLHDALDFHWRLLAAKPAKPAPFLVCSGYSHGTALQPMIVDWLLRIHE